MYRLVFVAIAAWLLIAGCAPAVPSAGGTGGGTAPAAGTGPAAQSAPNGSAAAGGALTDADYRQRVIDGARAEGEINALIHSTWTPEGIKLLEDAVEKEFGVRLKINFTPVGNYPVRVAALLTEQAANITPSFDLLQTSNTSTMTLLDENAVETVNWTALVPKETPAGVTQGDGRTVVVYTGHIGAMYDPTVIAEADAPRSLKDLANPRWRGKFMMYSYSDNYLAYTLVLGENELLAALRAAIANGGVPDTYANGFTRYAAKEYPISLMDSGYYATAVKRGIPAKFVSLDSSFNSNHHLTVANRAAHPNAAKLLAAVLVGPEGQRIAENAIGTGNRFYESSAEYRLEQEARAAGLPDFSWAQPAGVELARSPRAPELRKQIDDILNGG